MISLNCISFKWRFCQLRKWNKSSLVLWRLSEELVIFLSNTVPDLRTGLWELRIQWGKRIPRRRVRMGWGRAVLSGLLGAVGCMRESQRAVSIWGGEGERRHCGRRHWAAKITYQYPFPFFSFSRILILFRKAMSLDKRIISPDSLAAWWAHNLFWSSWNYWMRKLGKRCQTQLECFF